MNPGVDFSVFPRLEELALADVNLGKIAELPPSLLSFTATIGIMSTNCTHVMQRLPLSFMVSLLLSSSIR
jgi:hypothetical protein